MRKLDARVLGSPEEVRMRTARANKWNARLLPVYIGLAVFLHLYSFETGKDTFDAAVLGCLVMSFAASLCLAPWRQY